MLTLTFSATLPTLVDRSTPYLDSTAADVEAMRDLVLLCSPLQAPVTSEAWQVDEEEELRLQSLHQFVCVELTAEDFLQAGRFVFFLLFA